MPTVEPAYQRFFPGYAGMHVWSSGGKGWPTYGYYVNRARKKPDINVLNITEIANAMASMTRVMLLLRGAIASISLLVSGIRIMSIMLVSLGGCFIGLIAGIGTIEIIKRLFQLNSDVTASSTAISFAVSLAVGVIFGFYPARKVARL